MKVEIYEYRSLGAFGTHAVSGEHIMHNAHAHALDEVKNVTNKRMNKAILVYEMNDTG